MSDNDSNSAVGRTWPDLLTRLPLWLFAAALFLFAVAIVYAVVAGPVSFGLLGTVGKVSSTANSIVAFNMDGCPVGWTKFGDAAGRTLVGSGGGNDTGIRVFGTKAGVPTQALAEANIPAHNHLTPLSALNVEGEGKTTSPWGVEKASHSIRASITEPENSLAAKTSPWGVQSPQPLDNMQPYLVVTFCTPS